MPDTLNFVNNLNLISRSIRSEHSCLLSERGRDCLSELVVELKREDPTFGRSVLSDWLKYVDLSGGLVIPPLEMIWTLNEEELLFVTTYFFLRKDYVDELVRVFTRMYRLSRDDDSVQEAVTVICNVIVVVINTLKHHNDDIKAFFHDICARISIEAVKLINEGSSKDCYLSDLKDSEFLFDSCFVEYVHIGLKEYLKTGTKGSDVDVNIFKLSSVDVMTTCQRDFLGNVVGILPQDVILNELRIYATSPTVNFDRLLPLLSVLAVDKPDAMGALKDMVLQWLTDGDHRTTHVALLVARHCSYHKAKCFESYERWLETLPWKSVDFAAKFYNLLTDLVPSEPPLYLKIHANKIPSISNQALATDYVKLAKTRLSDLNESTNYICIFGDCYDTDAESENSDVSKVIAHFKEKREIAQPVLEASVFRKQYYENVFLKQLLKVPENEDPVRAAVVNSLYSMKKIPSPMYISWKNL